MVAPERAGVSAVRALTAHPERYRRLAARYHVVAYDPRGTGRSTPVTCLDDRALDAFWATDLTPDTVTEHRRARAAVRAYAAACRARSGALLHHLGRDDDVADLELLRRALGTSRLNYLATAHGTRLGQDYARAHPHRVGRVVLDSVEDPRQRLHPAVPSARAVDEGLERLFARCVELDPQRCPLGRSTRQASRTYHRLLARLDRRPVPAPGGRRLTETLARLAAVQAVRAPQDAGTAFVDGVAEALAGAGGTLLALADAAVGRGPRGHYAPEATVRAALDCSRAAGSPPVDQPRPRSLRQGSPTALLGRYLGARCARPPAGAAAQGAPAGASAGRPADHGGPPAPVLVLHNVTDPVTDAATARRIAARLPGARLVLHPGYGHRVRAVAGTCLRSLVDRFLLDGRLPERATTVCRGAVDTAPPCRSAARGAAGGTGAGACR